MHSHRVLWAIGIVIWSAVVLTVATRAVSPTHSAVHSRNGIGQSPASDLNITLENHRASVQSKRTITKAEAPTLRIQAEYNGGLQIQSWDTDNYSVTLQIRRQYRRCTLTNSHDFSERRTGRSGPFFARPLGPQ
jgi:hypothetical protein